MVLDAWLGGLSEQSDWHSTGLRQQAVGLRKPGNHLLLHAYTNAYCWLWSP